MMAVVREGFVKEMGPEQVGRSETNNVEERGPFERREQPKQRQSRGN